MTVDDLLDKLAPREYVVCAFIRESLNMPRDRFNTLFGHLKMHPSPSGADRFRTDEALPIIRENY
jgi:hypothetical protein